jgi:hypothetical protein
VVKGTVFLHQNDDMLRILPGAAGGGIDGEGPPDAGGEETRGPEGGGLLEEIATGIHGGA